jgi:hypothetical protein
MRIKLGAAPGLVELGLELALMGRPPGQRRELAVSPAETNVPPAGRLWHTATMTSGRIIIGRRVGR